MHVEAREWGVTAGGDKFRRGQISLKHAHLELPGGLLWGQGALPEGGRHPPRQQRHWLRPAPGAQKVMGHTQGGMRGPQFSCPNSM